MRTGAEHAAILRECRRRMLALETDPMPAAWKSWEVNDRLEQAEHGPLFSIPTWFDTGGSDQMRMRYLRAVADLETAEMLVRYCRYGRKVTCIRLTDEGMKAAAELDEPVAEPADKPTSARHNHDAPRKTLAELAAETQLPLRGCTDGRTPQP